MPTPPLTPPVGVEVLATPGGIVLRRRWYNRMLIIPLIFAAGWDVFAVFFYRLILSLGPVPAVAMVFPVAGLVLAVAVTYAMCAALVNRTEITISAGSVRVAVEPLLWPGNKMVASTQIREVLVKLRYVGRGGRTYRVLYVDPQHQERGLLARAATQDWARFVAASVCRRFRLPSGVD